MAKFLPLTTTSAFNNVTIIETDMSIVTCKFKNGDTSGVRITTEDFDSERVPKSLNLYYNIVPFQKYDFNKSRLVDDQIGINEHIINAWTSVGAPEGKITFETEVIEGINNQDIMLACGVSIACMGGGLDQILENLFRNIIFIGTIPQKADILSEAVSGPDNKDYLSGVSIYAAQANMVVVTGRLTENVEQNVTSVATIWHLFRKPNKWEVKPGSIVQVFTVGEAIMAAFLMGGGVENVEYVKRMEWLSELVNNNLIFQADGSIEQWTIEDVLRLIKHYISLASDSHVTLRIKDKDGKFNDTAYNIPKFSQNEEDDSSRTHSHNVEQIAQYQRKLGELSKHREQLVSNVDVIRTQRELENLKKSVEEESSEVLSIKAAYERKLNAIQEEIRRFEREKNELEKRKEGVRKNIEALNHTKNSLNTQLSQAHAEFVAANTEVAELNAKERELDKEIAVIQQRTKPDSRRDTEAIANAKRELNNKERLLKELRSKYDEEIRNQTNLRSEIIRREDECKKKEEEVKKKEVELSDLKTQTFELERQISKLTQISQDAADEINNKQRELQGTLRDIEGRRQYAEQYDKWVHDYNREYKDVITSLSTASQTLAQLQGENTLQAQKITEGNAQLKERQEELSRIRLLNDEMVLEINRMTSDIQKIDGTIREVDKKLEETESSRKKMRLAIHNAEKTGEDATKIKDILRDNDELTTQLMRSKGDLIAESDEVNLARNVAMSSMKAVIDRIKTDNKSKDLRKGHRFLRKLRDSDKYFLMKNIKKKRSREWHLIKEGEFPLPEKEEEQQE